MEYLTRRVLNNNFVQLQWRRNVETTLFERDYFGLEHAKFLKLANELMLQVRRVVGIDRLRSLTDFHSFCLFF